MSLNLTKNINKLFILAVLLLSVSFVYAADDVYLSLSGTANRASIGLAEFVPVNGFYEEMNLSRDFKDTLEADLILSRHFNVAVAKSSYKFDLESQFAYWLDKRVSVLVTGTLSIVEQTKLIVGVKLYDIESQQLIWEGRYSGSVKNYRYLAHKINDEIVKRFTGEEGIACSKIAFINNSTKFKEIYIVDYDGYNLRRLTKDSRLNVLPRWVPNSPQIIYTSYLYNNPDLFILDIARNKRRALSTIQGLNSPTACSPDKKSLVATLSRGVYPNLFLLDRTGVIVRRLTEGKFIDTSPSFSPSGKEIVFISDRAGYPQIYIMDMDGANLRRLSTKGNCDSPTWSPKGDKIAFTMKHEKYFDIFLYDLPKQKIIRLTEGQGNNENPTWSQDGRFLAFASTRSGKSEIYIMGMDGTGVRKLVEMRGESFTPSWSQGVTQSI
ncbi:MAG: PD40 domain-containing protein [Elusimicrobia bacterium]|nr:PD40 domain-containing protein [Elusimicrobiota bacterium]